MLDAHTNAHIQCGTQRDLTAEAQLDLRLKSDKHTGNGTELKPSQLPCIDVQLTADFHTQFSCRRHFEFNVLSAQTDIIGNLHSQGELQRALKLYLAIYSAAGAFALKFLVQLELIAQGGISITFPGTGTLTAGHPLIGDTLVSVGGVDGDLRGVAGVFQLHIGEYLFDLKLRTGDGGCGVLDLNQSRLEQQHLIIAIEIGHHRAHRQMGDPGIGILKNVDVIVIVGTDQGICPLHRLDDHSPLSEDRKVGGFVIIQIVHQLRVIIVYGACKQSLHIGSVHRSLIGLTQRRTVVGIQQKCLCQEIILLHFRKHQRCLRLPGSDGFGSCGQQLTAVFGIKRHHQHRFFQRIVNDRSHTVGDLKPGNTVPFFRSLLRCGHGLGYFLTDQVTKAIDPLHSQLSVVHSCTCFLRLGKNRHHTGNHHQNQQQRNYSFFHGFHFLFCMIL